MRAQTVGAAAGSKHSGNSCAFLFGLGGAYKTDPGGNYHRQAEEREDAKRGPVADRVSLRGDENSVLPFSPIPEFAVKTYGHGPNDQKPADPQLDQIPTPSLHCGWLEHAG